MARAVTDTVWVAGKARLSLFVEPRQAPTAAPKNGEIPLISLEDSSSQDTVLSRLIQMTVVHCPRPGGRSIQISARHLRKDTPQDIDVTVIE